MLNLTFELKVLNGNKMNESALARKILKNVVNPEIISGISDENFLSKPA